MGSFPANAHGLFDVGGNVWQWCDDWFDAPDKDRVQRGASWSAVESRSLLSSFRNHMPPDARSYGTVGFGFRCVLAPAH